MRARGIAGLIGFGLSALVPAAASAATFNVNTTADTVTANACAGNVAGACSLREAVIESNASPPAAGQSNTINVPAGTYTLTRSDPTENGANKAVFDSVSNELDIEVNTHVLGAGAGTDPASDTIIQAGTSPTNGISLLFIVNGYSDVANIKPLDATLSGMTMRFGRNQYNLGGGMWGFGGAVEYESGDGGQLTLSNDLITQNSTTDGDGGGVAVFDDAPNNVAPTSNRSLTTITNTTISGNTAVETQPGTGGAGGGVFAGTPEPLVVQNSIVTGNAVEESAGCTQCSDGGGLFMFGPNLAVAGATPSSISDSTISDNTASFAGAGVWSSRAMTITGSTFSDNTTTNSASIGGGGTGGGAGIWSSASPTGATITGSTFTGNDADGGAGGAIANNSGTLTVTDSRITGNSAATGSGVDQVSNNVVGVTSATEDWWGCNGGPGAAGCDTAANQNTTAGSSLTTSPWVTLRTSASPSVIEGGQSSTLTTSFLKDSSGAALTTAQISELIGLPVTWSATHGSISAAQATIQSSGTATATVTNANTCTNTTGEAAVDNVGAGDSLATATVTVQCADLTATKTDDTGGTLGVGGSFNWTIDVANSGATASFTNGQLFSAMTSRIRASATARPAWCRPAA